MSASKVHALARSWVENDGEFDWDEVPSHVRVYILQAAFYFTVWATNYERVIEPNEPDKMPTGDAFIDNYYDPDLVSDT
jgi:hypothetical protein